VPILVLASLLLVLEPSEEDALTLATQLRAGLARLGRRLRAERPEQALSLSKLSALGCLRRNGPMSPGQLASHEHLRPQSLTRILSGLEREQLVVRKGDATDHRRFIIEITQIGTDLLRDDMVRRDVWLAKAVADKLSRTERGVLLLAIELINRLVE
jgi:DNA-binding MarR family transcriptional regulator